ncbi:MAG TPA: DNA mismatch repair endonuclease MutL [Chloroflexi bacterium]|nr:DNA mismatch repair endonuclease MutL [Chloroflexota bacterium]
MPIRILSPEVVSKIAAGEVIERPASVVKELIENSIDAGASEIKVEVRQGGRRLMRVIDDGEGIPAEEVELAFERHSTSKLKDAEDLYRIATLGFRGEALPSIAAVSKVTMVTRTKEQEVGVLLRLEGGKVIKQQKKGAPPGTVVSVEDLFFNTPARLKFLRKDSTEGGHISDLVTRYALAYPSIRFSLLSEGRTLFRSTGSGSLYDVLIEVYGLETARQMLEIASLQGPVAEEGEGPKISGYVGAPGLHRASGRYLTIFINGRWVRDQLLGYAIKEAYHTLLPKGRHPVAVVRLDLSPEEVDINVHPAKAEVRFRRSGEVFAAVQKAVRHTLKGAPIPVVASPRWAPEPRTPISRPSPGQMALEVQRTEEIVPPKKIPLLRVLGQLGCTYIITEGPEGMYLIDQHAAHERVLYERLLSERAKMAVSSQSLLEPLTLDLDPEEAAILEEKQETLRSWGFDLEPFGGQTYLLRAVPAILKGGDLSQAVREVIDEASRQAARWEEEFVISLACHGAVRAGQTMSDGEMRELVRQLEETSSPRTCPHGRPTMIHLSAEQLQKEFGRS